MNDEEKHFVETMYSMMNTQMAALKDIYSAANKGLDNIKNLRQSQINCDDTSHAVTAKDIIVSSAETTTAVDFIVFKFNDDMDEIIVKIDNLSYADKEIIKKFDKFLRNEVKELQKKVISDIDSIAEEMTI